MTDDQKEQVNALQDKLPDIELSNKTIKWMAHYDINPSDGKSESPAISLFQTKYRSGALRQMCFTFSLANLVGSAPSIFPLAKGHRIRYNKK